MSLRACLSVAVLSVTLVGCADYPNLDDRATPVAAAAPYPRIAPIEGLIIRALGPARGGAAVSLNEAAAGDLSGRIAALKRRAAILRGNPVDDTVRARLGAVR